jgi:predicted RNase H-like nuclease (RuvC/YqgF family)
MDENKLDLQAIKARAEAATPGPWTQGKGEAKDFISAGGELGFRLQINPTSWQKFATTETAAFIAHARADIPALLAEIERLRKTNELLEKSVDILQNRLEVRAEEVERLTAEIEKLKGDVTDLYNFRDA